MTTPTTETLTAAVETKRVALAAAEAAATRWTGQGQVAFCRGELARAEAELAAAQPETVAKAAADAASRAEWEAFNAERVAERVAARRAAIATPFRPARSTNGARAAKRCGCGHCMACIGE